MPSIYPSAAELANHLSSESALRPADDQAQAQVDIMLLTNIPNDKTTTLLYDTASVQLANYEVDIRHWKVTATVWFKSYCVTFNRLFNKMKTVYSEPQLVLLIIVLL